MHLEAGTVIDESYRITRMIRRGEGVDVYEAQPVPKGPPVFVSVLRMLVHDGDKRCDVLEETGLALCRFSHDAFPEVVDYGSFRSRPFVVTEAVSGHTLADVLANGALRPVRAIRVLTSIQQAVHAAHHRGFVHGKLGADRILIDENGRMQLFDFGARAMVMALKANGPIDRGPDFTAIVDLSKMLMKAAKSALPVEPAQIVEEEPVFLLTEPKPIPLTKKKPPARVAPIRYDSVEDDSIAMQPGYVKFFRRWVPAWT